MNPADRKPLISTITTFYNEEGNLPELLERLCKVLSKLPVEYELIFVDAASTDRSPQILQEWRQKNPRVKIIRTSRKFGVEQCLVLGLQYAKGDAVVMIDADVQDPPEVIPALFEKWQAGNDVVHTIRTKRYGENPQRMFLTKYAYRIIRWLATIDIPNDAGLFKMFSRRAVDELLKLDEKDPYLRGLAVWIGYKQDSVLYEREARFAGKSNFSSAIGFGGMAAIRAFVSGIVSFSGTPLYLLAIVGFFLISLSGLALAAAVALRCSGMPVSGLLIFSLIVALFSGVQIFGMGVLGVYLSRVLEQVRHRPLTIVERAIGFDEEKNPQAALHS